jgi:hypothetical protein
VRTRSCGSENLIIRIDNCKKEMWESKGWCRATVTVVIIGWVLQAPVIAAPVGNPEPCQPLLGSQDSELGFPFCCPLWIISIWAPRDPGRIWILSGELNPCTICALRARTYHPPTSRCLVLLRHRSIQIIISRSEIMCVMFTQECVCTYVSCAFL